MKIIKTTEYIYLVGKPGGQKSLIYTPEWGIFTPQTGQAKQDQDL